MGVTNCPVDWVRFVTAVRTSKGPLWEERSTFLYRVPEGRRRMGDYSSQRIFSSLDLFPSGTHPSYRSL